MGKCSACGSEVSSDNDPTQLRGATGANYSDCCKKREEGEDATGLSASFGEVTLDPGSKDHDHQLKRSVVAISEKVKLLQESFGILGKRQESNYLMCKEREKVFRDLAKLHETQAKTIVALQSTIAMQSAQIAELTMKIQDVETLSYDGTLMWKITDYRRKKQEAATRGPASFYSDCFFTSRFGYKMCGRIYLNGDGIGKGTHLSIFFAIKKGDNDSFLKWPFRQRVCFRLMNQSGGSHVEDAFRPDPESSSFSRPRNDMNIASGCPLFVSQEVLENPQKGFLKDDTIYLQIQVDTSNL